METRAFDLSVSTYGEVRQHEYEVVILPWGATEPHNLHLPYWTDSILVHDISVAAAKKAYDDDGVLAMVMPPVGFGAQNPGQRELPFCIHTRQSTQEALLNDIVASLHHQGFRRLLIVNGHGGNQFKGMIRDLNVAFPDMMIASSEWYRQVNAKDYFEHPGDHADEIETSVMMYFHPEWVRLEDAGAGEGRQFRLQALREGSVWMPRDWSRVTKDTGIGNPMASTAEKGKRFVEATIAVYAKFLHEFAAMNDSSQLYE